MHRVRNQRMWTVVCFLHPQKEEKTWGLMALCSVRSSYTDRAPGHCGEPEQPRLLAGSQGNSVARVLSKVTV
jgi:hypothetical protein